MASHGICRINETMIVLCVASGCSDSDNPCAVSGSNAPEEALMCVALRPVPAYILCEHKAAQPTRMQLRTLSQVLLF
jgi:hypothetical protein